MAETKDFLLEIGCEDTRIRQQEKFLICGGTGAFL